MAARRSPHGRLQNIFLNLSRDTSVEFQLNLLEYGRGAGEGGAGRLALQGGEGRSAGLRRGPPPPSQPEPPHFFVFFSFLKRGRAAGRRRAEAVCT